MSRTPPVPIHIAGTIMVNGRVVTFTPASPLASFTTYTVTLTQAIKDKDGLSLPALTQWHFTTRDSSEQDVEINLIPYSTIRDISIVLTPVLSHPVGKATTKITRRGEAREIIARCPFPLPLTATARAIEVWNTRREVTTQLKNPSLYIAHRGSIHPSSGLRELVVNLNTTLMEEKAAGKTITATGRSERGIVINTTEASSFNAVKHSVSSSAGIHEILARLTAPVPQQGNKGHLNAWMRGNQEIIARLTKPLGHEVTKKLARATREARQEIQIRLAGLLKVDANKYGTTAKPYVRRNIDFRLYYPPHHSAWKGHVKAQWAPWPHDIELNIPRSLPYQGIKHEPKVTQGSKRWVDVQLQGTKHKSTKATAKAWSFREVIINIENLLDRHVRIYMQVGVVRHVQIYLRWPPPVGVNIKQRGG